jgi:hypothetical protein
MELIADDPDMDSASPSAVNENKQGNLTNCCLKSSFN